MEEWERRKILGEWGVGHESARDRRERLALELDAGSGPLLGQRVRPRPVPFHRQPEGSILAAGGPRPYMVRLRAIDELTRDQEWELEAAWLELTRDVAGDAIAFARLWQRTAHSWNFAEVNDLIERHNRHYPAESRLPMNPRTGDFVLINGRPYTRKPLDASWILSRFPADGQT
jgi:hypothetical protein